jgi:hypothetical protein
MRTALLKKLYIAVEKWAQEHNVEPVFIEVKYTGLGNNVEIIVVAHKGLENWRDLERDKSLHNFLDTRFDRNNSLGLTMVRIMTEDEYEKYGGDEACNHLASLWCQQRLPQSSVSKIS